MRGLWKTLMAPGRMMHQRGERMKEQRFQFEAALKRFDLDRIVDGYRPVLTQKSLKSVDWKAPWPTVRLVEQERTKIAYYLRDHWNEAGFPEKPVFLIRVGMEKVWSKLQGRIHQRVFSRLDLPPFFDLKRDRHGLIMFEMTLKDTDQYGHEEWIGVQSKWIYGRNPPVFQDPLAGERP